MQDYRHTMWFFFLVQIFTSGTSCLSIWRNEFMRYFVRMHFFYLNDTKNKTNASFSKVFFVFVFSKKKKNHEYQRITQNIEEKTHGRDIFSQKERYSLGEAPLPRCLWKKRRNTIFKWINLALYQLGFDEKWKYSIKTLKNQTNYENSIFKGIGATSFFSMLLIVHLCYLLGFRTVEKSSQKKLFKKIRNEWFKKKLAWSKI